MRKTKKNVGNKTECYGCGLCVISCPHKVLKMRMNSKGFRVPYITDIDKCTGCGLCSKICNYDSSETPSYDKPVESMAAWIVDNAIRSLCSSGGIAFEIARHYIQSGYKICAVRYNPTDEKAEHYIAETENELYQSIGSKYLQSDTLDAFSKINLNEKHIIFGTPCQIDMWRRYLRMRKKEANFILIDFFCHGVPSYNIWTKYLYEHKGCIRPSSMITWRDKTDGWHSSWNISAYKEDLVGDARPYFRSSSKHGDGFFFLFLSNCALNPACYSKCKYKQFHSSADIRLGDLWGSKYEKNEKGVSAVLAFSEKGLELLDQLNITSEKVCPSILTEGQISKPLKRPWYYPICNRAIKSKKITIPQIRRVFVWSEIISYQIRKITRKWR